MALETLRSLFSNDGRFARAMLMMLQDEQILIRRADGSILEPWQGRSMFDDVQSFSRTDHPLTVEITDKGAKRVT